MSDSQPWWKRWFGRPDYSSWLDNAEKAGAARTPPSPPGPRTDNQLLMQIAKDVNTVKSIIVFSFWLSIIAGILIAYANSSTT